MVLRDPTVLRDLARASRLEWLEANGLGGYASGTVSGAHTRRYHGLLVAAARPPLGRVLLLSKLEETVVLEGRRFELGTSFFPGAVHPRGHEHLVAFERALFPSFAYEASGVRIRKTIAAVHGENATALLYEVLDAPAEFDLELRPLAAFRGHHELARATAGGLPEARFEEGVLSMAPPGGHSPALLLSVPGASFERAPDWYYRFEYPAERERGLDYREDLFTPGLLRVRLGSGSRLGAVVSAGGVGRRSALELLSAEATRRRLLLEQSGLVHPLAQALVLAADQFIVRREESGRSVLAGYPWLADWGRDAMLSVPGLCLATRRFGDARKVLRTWARAGAGGLLPQAFLEDGRRRAGESLAASLWMFVAAYRYLLATGDLQFVRDDLLPFLRSVAAVAERAGERGPLEAAPHEGASAIEVNALWQNALAILSEFERRSGRLREAGRFGRMARLARERFLETFWSERLGCLVERPGVSQEPAGAHQLLALSLPFPLLAGDKARKVLEAVEAAAGGDAAAFDMARSWLVGPYATALVRVHGVEGRRRARRLLEQLAPHLAEGLVGSLPGLTDRNGGPGPAAPARAASVAEALRAWVEDAAAEPGGVLRSVRRRGYRISSPEDPAAGSSVRS